MPVTLQTIAVTFQQIINDPSTTAWVPLGNFMNQWFGGLKTSRWELVEQPLPTHDPTNQYEQRWATFCAASTLYLCEKHDVSCPEWANKAIYTLEEPWFFHLDYQSLQETTPDVFSSRNIYCGNDIYANKYEFAEEFSQYLTKRRSA
jgi:hypothetical protein